MERPFKLGAVRVVSSSEVEVTVHLPSSGASEERQVFTLQQAVKKGISPKDFVEQLGRDLTGRISTLRGWSEEEVSVRHVTIQLQKELEEALFANADFRNKFEGQFTRMTTIKNFRIKKENIDIVYEEVSPVVLYHMVNAKEESASPQSFMTNTASYSLRNVKGSETFLSEFAKDIGKQVDDIWISDRLRLKNAVLRHLYNRRKKLERALKYVVLFLVASFLAFIAVNYLPNREYLKPQPALVLLKERLVCFRKTLVTQNSSDSLRQSIFDELDNMETFIGGLGGYTSEKNIQFISEEVEGFQEKLSQEGINLKECQ